MYHIILKYSCLGLCKFLKGSGYVLFTFVTPASGTLPTPGGAPLMTVTRNEWISEDAINSVFCNAVALQWLIILPVQHFGIWSAGGLQPETLSAHPGERSRWIRRHHNHNQSLAFLLEESKYWTFKLWGVTLVLMRSFSPNLHLPSLLG